MATMLHVCREGRLEGVVWREYPDWQLDQLYNDEAGLGWNLDGFVFWIGLRWERERAYGAMLGGGLSGDLNGHGCLLWLVKVVQGIIIGLPSKILNNKIKLRVFEYNK